jgi:hypothetical protein
VQRMTAYVQFHASTLPQCDRQVQAGTLRGY